MTNLSLMYYPKKGSNPKNMIGVRDGLELVAVGNASLVSGSTTEYVITEEALLSLVRTVYKAGNDAARIEIAGTLNSILRAGQEPPNGF